MESISGVGEQLRQKRKSAENALRAEFQESLMKLSSDLMRLSSDKLTTIGSDTSQRLHKITDEIAQKHDTIAQMHKSKLLKIEEETKKLYTAIYKLHKQSIEGEGAKWRKLLYILLPTALIFGLMLGVFATLYLSDPDLIVVKESEIVRSQDGTQYLPISKIPNLSIVKE